jgi:hypothetical protein
MGSVRQAKRKFQNWDRYTRRCMLLVRSPLDMVLNYGQDRAWVHWQACIIKRLKSSFTSTYDQAIMDRVTKNNQTSQHYRWKRIG